jgi:hypothetical protein
MLNRRRFIEGTVGMTGIAVASRSLALDTEAGPGRIELVLCDPRYACSVQFAQRLARSGATPLMLDRDIGVLWTGELAARFVALRGGAAMAGMTMYSDYHISQVFARSHARVQGRFEAMHDARGADTLRHVLRLSAADRDNVIAADFSDDSWPQRLADRLRLSPDRQPAGHDRTFTGGAKPAGFPGTLFSWVIAKA